MIIHAFYHRTIESIVCIFYLSKALRHIKKKPSSSTAVSIDQRDRRKPAKLPRSNEATGRVTKGQAAQPVYDAGLANEVQPL